VVAERLVCQNRKRKLARGIEGVNAGMSNVRQVQNLSAECLKVASQGTSLRQGPALKATATAAWLIGEVERRARPARVFLQGRLLEKT